MANRRMISLKVVDTDAFLEMPQTSQLLYFHLAMRADDDGFISNPKKIMKIVGSQDDDYKVIIAKKFVIPFESGICVIKHWLIHNLIRGDRYTGTQYVREKSQLTIDPQSRKYSLNTGDIPDGIPNGNQVVPQDRSGQDRLDKVIEDKDTVASKYLSGVPEEDMKYFTTRFGISRAVVADKAEDLLNYCRMHKKYYKNYKSFLLKALKSDFKLKEVMKDIGTLALNKKI